MTPEFDDDVLLLRPVNQGVNGATIEQHLAETPGAFRDPQEPTTWILAMHPEYIEKLRRARIEDPRSYPFDPRVVVSPDHVVVYPGTTGHGRKFVHWLLSQGPCDLTVRGQVIGRVALPSDIYEEEEWDDPDADLDPTERPPRTGTTLTIQHDREGLSEDLTVHDSGVLSYEQREPIDDPVKTYRRMAPELLAQWLELVKCLPLDADEPGPDGTYVDPVLVSLETPTNSRTPRIDAAHPAEPYRELMLLVNGWVTALREDRAAMPPGLLPFP